MNIFKNLSIHKWISIGFPIYLIVFEILLREFSKVDISSFLGPTLAASGLGFMIEVLKPKKIELTDDLKSSLANLPDNLTFRSKKDEKLVFASYGFVLICVLIWFYSCALSIKVPTSEEEIITQTESISFVSFAFILGCINYVIGVIFSSLKGE